MTVYLTLNRGAPRVPSMITGIALFAKPWRFDLSTGVFFLSPCGRRVIVPCRESELWASGCARRIVPENSAEISSDLSVIEVTVTVAVLIDPATVSEEKSRAERWKSGNGMGRAPFLMVMENPAGSWVGAALFFARTHPDTTPLRCVAARGGVHLSRSMPAKDNSADRKSVV